MPHAISLATAIVLGLICLTAGLLLGAMPIQNSKMTEQQRRASSLLCFVIAIIYIVMLFIGQDLATWTMLGDIHIVLGISTIPTIHGYFISKWDFIKQYDPNKKTKKRNRK